MKDRGTTRLIPLYMGLFISENLSGVDHERKVKERIEFVSSSWEHNSLPQLSAKNQDRHIPTKDLLAPAISTFLMGTWCTHELKPAAIPPGHRHVWFISFACRHLILLNHTCIACTRQIWTNCKLKTTNIRRRGELFVILDRTQCTRWVFYISHRKFGIWELERYQASSFLCLTLAFELYKYNMAWYISWQTTLKQESGWSMKSEIQILPITTMVQRLRKNTMTTIQCEKIKI